MVAMEVGTTDYTQYESISHDFDDRTLLDNLLLENPDISPEDEPFCHQYLEHLASYSLSKLSAEPDHLKERHGNILSQTQTLAFENYQTFIQAAECSKEVYKDFNIIEDHLNSVVENLPMFKATIEKFAQSSQEINACRKQNTLVLSRHTQLLEILEISQLMDTCVRNGYFEEALELSNFVKRLTRKFSTIKVIADIGMDVKKSTEFMLNQLLVQLKGNVQLPACLRIISYIRQLDVFSEGELRIIFLQARDSWFQSVLDLISKEDAYTHLYKVIDASRVNLFDIITQYKAIFSDDEPSYFSDSKKGLQFSNILHSWVIRKISDFIKVLQEDIDKGVGGRLDSIYAQSMYFGLSFSRIRADFRANIVSIFHIHVLKQFKCSIQKATNQFEDEIHTFSVGTKNIKQNEKKKGAYKDPSVPPHELLDFPPLASYLNHILTAINNLRQYSALPLAFQVKICLQTSLQKVMEMLEKWAHLESRSQLNKNSDNVKALCLIVCKYFLPYIDQVLKLFFKPESIQKIVGRIPSSIGTKQSKSVCVLDIVVLCNYMKEFVDLDIIREGIGLDGALDMETKSDIPETDDDQVPKEDANTFDDQNLKKENQSGIEVPIPQLEGDIESETTSLHVSDISVIETAETTSSDVSDISVIEPAQTTSSNFSDISVIETAQTSSSDVSDISVIETAQTISSDVSDISVIETAQTSSLDVSDISGELVEEFAVT